MDEKVKNYQEWIKKAENDLMAAQAIWNYYEKPPTDTICYHCHQVAEKALKGYLIFKEGTFLRIHDLVALLNLCLQKDQSLEFLKQNIAILNQYYIETKYPLDEPIEYSRDEAKEALRGCTNNCVTGNL
jgi:HEPN domain-containing protein